MTFVDQRWNPVRWLLNQAVMQWAPSFPVTFEFKMSGKMDFNGNEMNQDRTTTVEISNVGTTKVEVSDGAKKKLEVVAAPK